MKKTLLMTIIFIILLSAVLAGCTGSTTVEQNQTNTTADYHVEKLVLGVTDTSITSITTFSVGTYRNCLSQPGLTVRNSKDELVPGLAVSWTTNDSKVWTFNIRKDAVWNDGVPVTAQDVNFTIEYARKNKVLATAISYIASVQTPDDYTVIINLTKPRSDFPFLMATSFIVFPMHVFKDIDNPKTYSGPGAMMGYGPYLMDSYNPDTNILTFKANERYWGGKPSIDEIDVRIFKVADSMVLSLEKGEIDSVVTFTGGIPFYYVPKLLNDDNIKFSIEPDYGVPMSLWFDANKSPFNNQKFREAISYAFNYQEMCNLFAGGYGSTPSAGFVPDCTGNYLETRKLTYDVNKSKQLLGDAGFVDKDGDGFRELPDGEKFRPSIIVRSDQSDPARVAEMIKKYMNDVGIDVQINIMDYPKWWDMMSTYKYDMALHYTAASGMLMNGGYGTLYFDRRLTGMAGVTDPKFVGMIDELLNTTDQARAKQLGRDIQSYYADQLPAIPLYWGSVIIPYNKKYTGWTIHPSFGILSNETFYNLRVAR